MVGAPGARPRKCRAGVDRSRKVADNESMTAVMVMEGPVRDAVEVERPDGPSGWFNRLVAWHLMRRAGRVARPTSDATETVRARNLIRLACLKAAASGAAAGTVATLASVLTAQTAGFAAVVTVPLAATAIAVEMGFRTIVHVDLACDLADTFD